MKNFFRGMGRWFRSMMPWVKKAAKVVLKEVLIPTIQSIGKQALANMDATIIAQMSMDIPTDQKFANVFDQLQRECSSKQIAGSALRALIQTRYAYQKTIKL